MKFNLKLDESLFDDEVDLKAKKKNPVMKMMEFDDDFAPYEDEHSLDNVLPGPAAGADTGAASELIALIHDEWEAIEGYNNAIATLRTIVAQNPFYADAIQVLEEISAEENAHIGQLQEILKQISPNAQDIDKGTQEARSQLGLVDGKLPVQSWDVVTPTKTNIEDTPAIAEDELCTLTDVDDEM